MRILVTGQQGQLARSLASVAPSKHELVFGARPEFDLCDYASIEAIVDRVNPELIVNAAAWTDVDSAEDQLDAAMRINGEAPGVLARASKRIGARMIHLSTDYVFDGSGTRAWTEDDPIAPVNQYGRSKAAGEIAVREEGVTHVILRTSWVFSPFGRNFVKCMLLLARKQDTIRVVADQFGCPTSAACVAQGIFAVVSSWQAERNRAATGTFHLAGTGETSWAGLAEKVFATSAALAGPAAKIVRVPAAEYEKRAARPTNSRLDSTRFASIFGFSAAPWQDACVKVTSRIVHELTVAPRGCCPL